MLLMSQSLENPISWQSDHRGFASGLKQSQLDIRFTSKSVGTRPYCPCHLYLSCSAISSQRLSVTMTKRHRPSDSLAHRPPIKRSSCAAAHRSAPLYSTARIGPGVAPSPGNWHKKSG